jgi:predicted nucleic acid-binding protein
MLDVELFFLDTNVLIYASDPRYVDKQTAAGEWIELLWQQRSGRISWQVLNEYYANAIRKLGMPASDARGVVEEYSLWNPIDFSYPLIRRAWHWMDATQISYWDGLIVAAAEHSGCRWLLSEDLHTGQKFERVTIVNPFKVKPQDFGLVPGREIQ